MAGRVPCLLAISLLVVLSHAQGQARQVVFERRRVLLPQSPRVTTAPLGDPEPILFRPPIHHSGPITFPDIARAAGLIFSGRVIRIERIPASSGQSVETVAVTFHVENAIRGVIPGEHITISQWIGLWSSQRYRVGERMFLFLYPRSKLGLTSAVAGSMGRFDIDASRRVLLSEQHLSAFQKDPALGGKSRIAFRDFALAVRQASEEDSTRRGDHEN